jgi:glycosyltransferase involved in cell wall biosynthesis
VNDLSAADPKPDSPARASSAARRKIRLAYLVSHPIQYQAPLLRRIAQEQDIDLTVFFAADFSLRGYEDVGFGVDVQWDVPLVSGYRHEFLPPLRKRSRRLKPLVYGLVSRLRASPNQPGFDALWVHGYSTVNSVHGILAAKSLGIPILLRAESWLDHHDGTTLRAKSKTVAKRLFFHTLKHLIDGVLPIGTLNAAYWSNFFGDEMPQFLMPYAVDNDYFQRRSAEVRQQRTALQVELSLDPVRPVILFAAKLIKRKRCDDLIQAYLQLCAEAPDRPTPYLLIVGDGEERRSLEQQAAATGLDGIRFCGFRNQSELPRFFDLATVFVLPSQHEPWGLVVNEVMNAGCPVLLSNEVGCYPDLLPGGSACLGGRVFPVGDVDALCKLLKEITSNSHTAKTMGAQARMRIEQWSFEQDIDGLRRAIAHVTKGVEQ